MGTADAKEISRRGNIDILLCSDSESTVEIEVTDTICTLSSHQTLTEEIVPSSSVGNEVTTQLT